MRYNNDKLRKDLRNEYEAAFYGTGFGVPMMDAFRTDSASPEELRKMAQEMGLDLRKYQYAADDENGSSDVKDD